MTRPREELLQLEVRELTDLLRREHVLAGFREALMARGVPPSETILAGLIESEDETMYGVVVTASRESILFETAPDSSITRWEPVSNLDTLPRAFKAVPTALSMMADGEIA